MHPAVSVLESSAGYAIDQRLADLLDRIDTFGHDRGRLLANLSRDTRHS